MRYNTNRHAAAVAQLVEQRFCKPQVMGSSPIGGCFARRPTAIVVIASVRGSGNSRMIRPGALDSDANKSTASGRAGSLRVFGAYSAPESPWGSAFLAGSEGGTGLDGRRHGQHFHSVGGVVDTAVQS